MGKSLLNRKINIIPTIEWENHYFKGQMNYTSAKPLTTEKSHAISRNIDG